LVKKKTLSGAGRKWEKITGKGKHEPRDRTPTIENQKGLIDKRKEQK